uniref:Uncharacterized protein n=1 Tax=Ditylenchus dipsaci TaxID=166011 RepID=A0A915CQQ8_9BILA
MLVLRGWKGYWKEILLCENRYSYQPKNIGTCGAFVAICALPISLVGVSVRRSIQALFDGDDNSEEFEGKGTFLPAEVQLDIISFLPTEQLEAYSYDIPLIAWVCQSRLDRQFDKLSAKMDVRAEQLKSLSDNMDVIISDLRFLNQDLGSRLCKVEHNING